MASPTATAGSLALAALVHRVGAPVVARAVRVTPGAVSNWAAGRRYPSPPMRRALARRYAIATEAWDQPTTPNAGPTMPQDAPAPDVAASVPPQTEGRTQGRSEAPGRVDAMTTCAATVRGLLRELARLEGDPVATSRERAAVSTALTSATRLLAKLSGDLELTHAMIVRSRPFAEMMALIEKTILPYPEVALALAAAFAPWRQ